MLLSGDSEYQLRSLNSASAAETFSLPATRPRSRAAGPVLFFFGRGWGGGFISQKCLPASAAVARLTVGFVFELCNRGGSC